MNKHNLLLIAILSLSLLLISCSRANNKNYRKFEVGMEYGKIVQILGNPTQGDSVLNAKDCTWGSKSKSIDIQFVADKVVFFSSTGI